MASSDRQLDTPDYMCQNTICWYHSAVPMVAQCTHSPLCQPWAHREPRLQPPPLSVYLLTSNQCLMVLHNGQLCYTLENKNNCSTRIKCKLTKKEIFLFIFFITPKKSISLKYLRIIKTKHNVIQYYRTDPKFLDRWIWANSADPDQTVCNSLCIFWTHYSA